jgi:DNA-binding beta-propeller fold protein YncE
MQINDVVLGLAAGVGVDLSPDGKIAYYVEWSIGELSKVEVKTGKVTTVKTGLSYPEDVEVDWKTGEIFVSERTGAVIRVGPGEKTETIVKPGGAPQQLDLKKNTKRYLYTVCYDSGHLLRIDVDAKTTKTIASGLGHPVGVVIDAAQKYAYVTEQDKKALTRIELKNGKASQLYTGLVSPFFLAWDKNAKGIFCVQRDPANSLVRLKLGNPVTLKTVAGGLAWRPSGVAPNADNKLIYICADRELEVICLNGCPTIKPAKPPFEIYSIQFNYDKSAAIRLKDHLSGAPVPLPEYVKGVRKGPAAYVAGTLPRIKVVLKKLSGFVGGAYAIGATGNLGGVRRKIVTPVFNPSGLSNPIDFELMWPLPGTVGKPDVTLDWYARKSPGPSIPASIGSASHRLYLVMAKPTQPWVSEIPWVAALEIACGWAAGAASVDGAAGRITERYYNCGQVQYDDISGATFYGNSTYMLSEMIERLNGGPGLGQKVNCTDSANTVSTLTNLLGCDLWQCRMGWSFDLNPILAIGFPPPNPWPQWSGFSYHEIPWKGACTQNDSLFDGCLMVDGDQDPTTAPHVWLLPTNMLFGDCTTMNYRLRLCPPGPDGCAKCQPQPSTRQRRPIS